MGVMEIIIKGVDKASDVVEKIEGKTAKATESIEKRWVKIGVAAAAAGLAIEGMAKSQAQLTQDTKILATNLGLTEKEMRELAISTSNVTFPLQDVVGLMQTAYEQGVRGEQALQDYAYFWDTVGDATGEASTQLAQASSALRMVGIDAGNEKEALAAFGYITNNTTSSVGEFLNFIQRTGPEMKTLGLDVNDAAALMGILEHEMGLTSRMAQQELNAAIRESDGDIWKLFKTLGVSVEQFEEYNKKVEDSSDIIQRNADIHAESYTILQKLQHRISELTYKYAGFTQGLTALVPVMLVAGPAIKGLAAAKVALGTAATLGAKGVWALVAAKMALLLPIALVIAAIVAAVYVFKKLYEENEQFREVVDKAWSFIQDKVGTAMGFIIDVVSAGFNLLYTITEAAFEALMEFWTAHGEGITRVVTLAWGIIESVIVSNIKMLVEYVRFFLALLKGDWDRAWGHLKNIADIGANNVKTVVENGMELMRTAVYAIWDSVEEYINKKINGITDKIEGAMNRVKGFLGMSTGGSMGEATASTPYTGPAFTGGATTPTSVIKAYHTGGTFKTSNPGGEGLALLKDGERVVPPGQALPSGGSSGMAELAAAIAALVKPNITMQTTINSGASPEDVRVQQERLLRKLAVQWDLV